MKKVTLAIAMAALVLFAGCKKEKQTTGTTLTASIEQQKTGGSRTSINPAPDDQAEIHWTTGDKIVVNNGTSSVPFSLINGDGSTLGTFNYNGEYDFGDNNIAVYPETATISGSEITVTLPAEKAIAAPGVGVNPMMGTFSDPDQLTFTSLGGVLGISLTGDNKNITAVEIVSNKNEQLNGTFACTTGNPQLNVAATTDESQKKMRLTCTTTLTTTSAQTFYFALPVGALAEGFTLNVYGEGTDPIFSKSTSNNVSIVLNQVNQMDPMEVADAPAHPDGALTGVFTVSPGKQVYFSQGNLQYTKSTGVWSFMEHQYDMVESDGQNVGEDYANQDVISQFGFGTSGWDSGSGTHYQPWKTEGRADNDDNILLYGPLVNGTMVPPTGNYYKADWGYNAIINGGNRENMGWRTLTSDEWTYLIGDAWDDYSDRGGNRFARATVDNVYGLIILPDGWANNDDVTLNGINNYWGRWSDNTMSTDEWATLEAQGAAFLPAAGYRRLTSIGQANWEGNYWTSTVSPNTDPNCVRILYFMGTGNAVNPHATVQSYYGETVRLVIDKQD